MIREKLDMEEEEERERKSEERGGGQFMCETVPALVRFLRSSLSGLAGVG